MSIVTYVIKGETLTEAEFAQRLRDKYSKILLKDILQKKY